MDQGRLFPPAPKDLLPARHQAHFLREVVREELDLSAIYARDEDLRGYPPCHPGMMTALRLYGCCRGIYSSRCLEQACVERRIDACIVTGRQKHGSASATDDALNKQGPRVEAMREKLRAGGFTGPYRLRKQVVEPVFGQIQPARGFRQFLHRGLREVAADGSLLCSTHNLLRLFAVRGTRPAKV